MNEEKNILTEEKKEPSSIRLILALGITGMLSGIILVSAYLYTNPMILANKKAALESAIFKVLPECKEYTAMELVDGQLREQVQTATTANRTEEVPVVYAGYDGEGKLIGFAVPGSEPGFQDIIVSILGFDHVKKQIIGLQILESKETPGLGDKIFKDQDFQKNFEALVVDPNIEIVKKGEKTKANQVDAITGATISSKAVVASLNHSMEQWQEPIADFVAEQE